MKTSFLLCTTCLLVASSTGSAQHLFRFPSLSSALSSLTGFGGQNGQNGAQPGQQQQQANQQQQQTASSLYGGYVRDYGRSLMAAMSNIYPTLFKPPQSQMQQLQGGSGGFGGNDQAFASSSPYYQAAQGLSNLYQSATNGVGSVASAPPSNGPSFSFGGSTFSLSPSLPSLASLTGAASQGANSPFANSFGSSINSPSSFGPVSSFLSSTFGQQGNSPSGQQSAGIAPQSQHSAGQQSFSGASFGAGSPFDSSSNGLSMGSSVMPSMSSFGQQGFGSPFSAQSGMNGHHSSQSLMPASSQSNPINSYAPPPTYQGNVQNQGAPNTHQMFGGSHTDPSSLMASHVSSSFGSSGPNANGELSVHRTDGRI